MVSHGICVLFSEGSRPDGSAMQEFAESAPSVSVSYNPEAKKVPLRLVGDEGIDAGSDGRGAALADTAWLELLKDGMTFDCVGLAPRLPCATPPVDYRFDVDSDFDLGTLEGVMLSPGSHLSGGGRTLPVLRGLLALARDVVHHFENALVACWPPSQAAIGRRFFDSTVTSWLDGGPFPALGLTSFAEESDGSLVSVGLSHFINQELRIEPGLAGDKLAATRLGIRLINQLVLVGGIELSERIMGPDGSRLLLRPSRNGKFVRVSKE